MEDEHTLALTIGRLPRRTAQVGRQTVAPVETLPNTTDWYGRFRALSNANNDDLIDRELQKTASFTGIGSIFLQEQAATESMGPIYDRTQERLGTSDVMVIRTRKRLLDAVQALRDCGQSPPGVDNPEVYAIRSGGVVLPRTASWLEATTELRRGWAKHPDLTRAVLRGANGLN
jgi:phthalate 4,5-dioxygenase